MTSATGSKEVTIAITVIRNNSGLRLPSPSEGYVFIENKIIYIIIKATCVVRTLVPQVPSSPIFSLRINPFPGLNSLAENPIMMVFDVVR